MTRILRAAWLFSLILVLSAKLAAQGDPVSDLLSRTNQLRAGVGLGAYTLNGALSSAAQNQATWMANTGNVSHVQSDGSRPRDRAAAAGYNSPWVSENIYVGTMATTDTAWTFWINSAIHYAALTSPNYGDVGIAWAGGTDYKAFVMVFGGSPAALPDLPPPLTDNTAASNGSGQSGSAGVPASNPNSASSAPRARQRVIVGLDGVGNMMHEVQEGDTLGDIAMLYGYSWDVIPTVMAINRMDDNEIRSIKVGSVLLIPPHEGTYTPTPVPPTGTALPTVTPYSLSAFQTPLASATPEASPQVVAMVVDSSTYIAPSATPPGIIVKPLATVAPLPTPMPAAASTGTTDYRGPLLMLVVGVQMVFLGIGAAELVRRRKRI